MSFTVKQFNEHLSSEFNGQYLHAIFNLGDFTKLDLPPLLVVCFGCRRPGKGIQFPFKMKPRLRSSPKHFTVHAGRVTEAPRIPLETVSLTINTKACNRQDLAHFVYSLCKTHYGLIRFQRI